MRIRNGKIEINGEIIPFPEFLPSNIYYFNDADLLYQYIFNPDPKVRKFIKEIREKYPYRYGCIEQKTFTNIPEGHYFLLGDNSINSVDSRVFGWVPENHIFGRAFAIWWASKPMERLHWILSIPSGENTSLRYPNSANLIYSGNIFS